MFCTGCAAIQETAGACPRCGGSPPQRITEAIAGRAELTIKRGVTRGLYLAAVALLLALSTSFALTRPNPTGVAAWYDRAERAAALGDYERAISGYAVAASFRDAALRRDALARQLELAAANHTAASAAVAAGDHDTAISLLRANLRLLPRHDPSARLLAEARSGLAFDLRQAASVAQAKGDWLAAEHAVAALVALSPADDQARLVLADLRRRHTPILLARDRSLHLAGPSASNDRRLATALPAAWPTWSPDREQIAFTSVQPGQRISLYLLDAAGGEPRHLANDLRPYAGPVWNPAGTKIAYATVGSSSLLADGSTAGGIRVVDAATGMVSDPLRGLIPDALYPSWSPDGRRLAFVSRDEGSSGFAASAAPSGGDGAPTDLADGEIYAVDIETGAVTNLSQGRIAHPWRASWSPTGNSVLVYTRDPGASYDRDLTRLALLDAETGAITPVPTGNERITMPVWSPSGDSIAYAAGDSTLVVRTIAGGLQRFALGSRISRFVTWAPDGRTLLAVAEGIGDPSYLIPLDPASTPTALWLDYDLDRRQSGSPQWGATSGTNAPPIPELTVGGTALDHAPA